jgi:putative flavoprotein involved in K+ transport
VTRFVANGTRATGPQKGKLVERIETVIVGGGQAGLAMSYWLTAAGREHVILERGRLAERWRSERWDSLTLLTPNWAATLPGFPYAGDDPDGFMGKDQVAAFLVHYAAAFHAPLRTGVSVMAVRAGSGLARFRVESDSGEIEAQNLVAATGPFQEPSLPTWSTDMPAGVFQIHSSRYQNPEQLPPGAVLIVGAGSSGQQIAEDLVAAQRRVYLSVGRYRPAHRRYRGRDWTWWQQRVGYFDRILDGQTPDQPAIAQTGVGRGHELNLRQMAIDGVTLLGHVRGVSGAMIHAAPDLAETIAAADENLATFRRWFDDCIAREGIDAPPDQPRPVLPNPKEMKDPVLELSLEATGVNTVIWATGFRSAFDWIQLPVFDEFGRPQHYRGVTACPGMYFLGLRRLYKVKSSFMLGVGDDAAYLAEHIGAADDSRIL